MRSRIFILILVLALVAIGGVLWWVVKSNRPKADAPINETTQSFTTQPALKGSPGNPDAEQNVTVDSDGTIHLAPVGQ